MTSKNDTTIIITKRHNAQDIKCDVNKYKKVEESYYKRLLKEKQYNAEDDGR